MNSLIFTVLLIACGGTLPLFSKHGNRLLNGLGSALTLSGCLMGFMPVFKGILAGEHFPMELGFLLRHSLHFTLDPIAAFFLLPVFLIALLGKLYSLGYLDSQSRPVGVAVNNFFYNLLIISMVFLVYASDLLGFFISWEMMSIASLFLVIYDSQKETTRKAAYIYFAFTQFGGLVILSGFGLIFAHTNTIGFETLASLSEPIKIIVFVILLIGFGSKAGLFPLHIWLPYAHPAAPSHVSAVMSGVMIKMGIYGIIRFYTLLSFESLEIGYLVLVLGVLSGIYGVIQALGQHNLKRLLAYHSVENIGIIAIGLGFGMIGQSIDQPLMTILGFSGAMLHVLNHAIFKSLLFMGAGSIIHQTGIELIDQMGGLMKKMKVTGVSFLIGSLAIAGLPPLNGFISEFLIYYGGFQGIGFDKTGLIAVCLGVLSLAVIGGLALACFTKVVGIVFLGESRKSHEKPVRESGLAMKVPMIILAFSCLLIGLLPVKAVEWSLVAAHSIVGTSVPMQPMGFLDIIHNISLAVLGFGLLLIVLWGIRTLLYRGKTNSTSSTWGCGYTLASPKVQYTGSSYVDTILAFFKPVIPVEVSHRKIDSHFPGETHYHSEASDIVETNMHHFIIRPVFYLLNRLRWVQHGDIHLYIGYILLAVVALLIFI